MVQIMQLLPFRASPSLRSRLLDYASYHRTRGNQKTHEIGIPMIVFSLLGILENGPFPGPAFSGGLLFWIVTSSWYVRTDWKIGVPFSCLTLAAYFGAMKVSFSVHVGLFVMGWIVQLWGHSHFEKNRPAFTKNLEHLLIGPLWVFAKWTGYRVS
jgi:uncharacterized membrane protein YGL010W